MSQDVSNQGPIDRQLNIGENKGPVYFAKPTRLSKRFSNLRDEVATGKRFDKFIDDLVEYNTQLDGKSMPEKLEDGGFSKADIFRATQHKQHYWKKFEKNKYYESAQLIDLELFAKIRMNFETYIEPLIGAAAGTASIKQAVAEKIVNPIIEMLNNDGHDDILLNYTCDDILGMIYFLTGKCHLNWTVYDHLQPSI